MRIFISLALVIFTLTGFCQSIDSSYFKGLSPRSIGPAGMSGRVTSIDVNSRNEDHILIGTASGGVWESRNGGINWTPIFDEMPVQSIGSIAFDQNNPDVIWVGTGEGNPRNSHNSGKGIYRSLDAGKTWKLMGLENTKTIHRLIIDPRNSDVVYAAALGSAWGPNKERGLFKTTDGGQSWTKILYVNDTTGCADLIIDPTNPNKLFAAMWQYQRQPWFFTSGGSGSGLYVSYDAGATWKKRTSEDGLPKGNLGRIGLAISENNPQVVYALVEGKKFALYKSYDGGLTWKKSTDKNVGNRPFYYADIYADPSNENTLYSLFSFVNKSVDGGKSFFGITPYNRVHPDHHALWINPKNGNHVIDGNDGGLAISKDGGKTWRYVTNLPLGQFYHINIDNEIPYNIYGGMQDNGSWKGPAYVFERGGIQNHHWQELLFGDGFDVVPLPNDHQQGYAMYQGGNVSKYNINSGRTSYIKPLHPDRIPLRFNWNAAIAQDPFKNCGVYYGSQFLHYSNDCGNSWRVLSPDLTTNDSTKQNQAKSGGLTIDATNAENFTTIVSIAPSPLDSNIIWVGTDDGNLQQTIDRGQTWVNMSERLPDFPQGAWIPQIQTSVHSLDEVYVVVNDYRRNNWNPYVYRTVNGGNTWTRIVDQNKVKGHVWSVVQDDKEKDMLFCGTDFGLYVSLNGGNDWMKWNVGIPSTPISDLKIHPRESDLIIGTFGRAAYVLDDIEALRQMARVKNQISENPFMAFKPKITYQSPRKNAKGIRFAADAEYKGQNRRGGVMLTYFIHPDLFNKKPVKGDTAKPKGPTKNVEYVVYNASQDTLRYHKFKADTMMNRVYWNMREDGTEYLSRSERKRKEEDKKFKPVGMGVLPGQYQLVMFYKGYQDTVQVTIQQNPNFAIDENELKQRYDEQKKLQGEYKEVVNEVNKLKAIATTVNRINQLLPLSSDSIADSLKNDGKILLDSVNVLLDEFFLPKDFVGYDHVSVKLSNKLGKIYSYLNSENALESQMLELAIEDFRSSYAPVQARMKRLFENEWAEYQGLVKTLEFDYFKKYNDLNVKP